MSIPFFKTRSEVGLFLICEVVGVTLQLDYTVAESLFHLQDQEQLLEPFSLLAFCLEWQWHACSQGEHPTLNPDTIFSLVIARVNAAEKSFEN